MGLSLRRTRAKYHYAIRSVKRNKDEIIRMRFAEALLSDNNRDYWGEGKKLRYSVSWLMVVTLMLILLISLHINNKICIPVCPSMLMISMKIGQISLLLFKLEAASAFSLVMTF